MTSDASYANTIVVVLAFCNILIALLLVLSVVAICAGTA